jgi:hypothetical protein
VGDSADGQEAPLPIVSAGTIASEQSFVILSEAGTEMHPSSLKLPA